MIIHSLFNFLFSTSSSAEEIEVIRNNMEIVKGNQNVLSSQIQKIFTFVNFTYTEAGKTDSYLSLYNKTLSK